MRKKSFRNVLSVLLVATMTASMFTGCSNKSTPNNATDNNNGQTLTGETLFNEPGTLPIVKEPITLTVFAPSLGEFSHKDNLQVKEIEEATGIKLEFQTAATSDSIKDKLSTLFASGEVPDIILTGVATNNRYDKATEAMLASQGLILPIDQYLDTVSVGYKAAMEEFEGMREYITSVDGHVYSIPNVDSSLHIQYPSKLFINVDWLERLGLEKPRTTEELYQVLKAFKENDANGNGDPNDEIPLTAVTSDRSATLDAYLMQPFQLTPYEDKLYLEDGKVTFAPTQEGYKEGLKYLNKLYSEGLITPECFTQDFANQVNTNEGGDTTKYGAAIGMRPGLFCSINDSDRWLEYECVDPITGPSGTVTMPYSAYSIFQTGMTFISSSCKNPEAAFRLLDYLSTPEQVFRSYYGIEGKHWEKARTGDKGIDGNQAVFKVLPTEDQNYRLDQLVSCVRTPEMIYGKVVNEDTLTPFLRRDIVIYEDSLVQQKVSQKLESVMPDLYMSLEEAEEMSMLKTTIMDAQQAAMVDFITGAIDIEKGWSSYIDTLNGLGLPRYLELLQNAYDNSAFAK